MHEWALAEAVARTVEELVLSGRDVKHVEVVLGELQAVDEEVFRVALEELLSSLRAEKGVSVGGFTITREKALFKCNVCGHTWSLDEWGVAEEFREAIHFVPEAVHSYYSCPKCGSRDFEIVKGRGVQVRVR
ncbi:hydrogenase nickel incorporation protein HypA [Infirmifilum lucidum]|uniref:Hydrogenase nickel incorporation protein HypA n=1 Tax=Infirmifilum lucidum TaxID=2776706 RepID=A0A7L9FGP3_9CREN|nr:hydrogenase nickel incorporation protein HypA [Infirmifilum lucidum]QOJ78998.1 hydrogenase nickel incorporation protein HypA [Infirmifilum lucidum]